MGVLSLCARQYLFKYVEKLKESTGSESSRVGVSVHTILEYALKNPGKSIDEVVEITILNDKLTLEEALQVRNRIAAIEAFVERMEQFKLTAKPISLYYEQKIAISPEFKSVDFFSKENTLLRGVVDYAMVTHDGVLIIIDHKSGKKKKIDEHAVQLNAYRVMGMAAFPEATSVQCAINYVGQPKLDWAPRSDGRSGPYTRSEVKAQLHPWLEHYLNSQGRKLLALESGEAQAELGWQCEYCGYTGICDAGKQEVQRRRAKRGDPPLDI
jgi:CRISPR/Cas system-associated exonuclease Cas4 (RecB family)